MVMELNIDFAAYMWIIGILMVLAAVVGSMVVAISMRRRDRRREETMADSRNRQTWDAESPGHFGHG